MSETVVPLTYENWRARELNHFGSPDGLGKRLAMWSNQLRRNRAFPWIGVGIIADLEAAAKELGADPAVLYPENIPVPYEEDEFANFVPSPPVQEFDL